MDAHAEKAHNMTDHTGATRTGSSSAAQEGPRKKQKTGITMSQKQALIDNLQLESTFAPSGMDCSTLGAGWY